LELISECVEEADAKVNPACSLAWCAGSSVAISCNSFGGCWISFYFLKFIFYINILKIQKYKK
jgi:hypothetical protein